MQFFSFSKKYSKPVIISEYGADTLEGLHLLPTFIWTEEFQMELFSKHFEAFDTLRNEGFFIGEFVWNFADFQTKQGTQHNDGGNFELHIASETSTGITRLSGNKKGVFTRSRQPKSVAQMLRMRYFDLAMEIDKLDNQPSDLDEYMSPIQEKFHRIEL